MDRRLAPSSKQVRGELTRQKLIDAAVALIRAQGYAATSVEQLCAHAGVTKGAFFHHFTGKDDLAAAAARYWGRRADELFAVPGHDDPVAVLLAYCDARTALMEGTLAGCTCLAGTMVQEVHSTSEPLREACAEAIFGHAAMLEAACARALARHGVGDMTAASLALHIQAVVQGAFIVAKAAGDMAPARDTMAHLRRYLLALFKPGE